MLYNAGMTEVGHYIKEWRVHNGLSLRKLADRMEVEPGENLISYASLSRIEKGEQPYSQPILEALSKALGVPVAYLLSRKPDTDADIVSLYDSLDEASKLQAVKIMKAMSK